MERTPKIAKSDKGLNDLIKNKYYPININGKDKIITHDKKLKKDKRFIYFDKKWLVKLDKDDKTKREALRQHESVGIFNNFKTIPGSRKLSQLALKCFDKIIVPRKTLIPRELQSKYDGIQHLYLRKINGKPNNIKYYTKNKSLSKEQCKVLHADEQIRGKFGFTVNDKPLQGKYFDSYIKWLIRNTKDENTVEEKTYREISVPVKTNTDGSRQPGVIQMGLNSYMKRNALINPVQIIDAHIKKEKLKIFDTINLGGVLSELNILPAEAFDYICSYLNKNRDKKRLHTQDRELMRGASALKNLIDFYNAEKERTTIAKRKDKKIKIFSYRQLMESKQYAEYCTQVSDLQIREYETFKKWIRKKLDAIALVENK
jgi:hypothetical protein